MIPIEVNVFLQRDLLAISIYENYKPIHSL